MYQALYRKWRPQTFDEVVGQQHITETLKSQVKNNRLSHAYLFIGTRGTGKTTCARILARAVNCEHPENGNPCGKCSACRGILEGSVMDVVELDAASNNGVDNVRALREEAVFSPSTVKKRVYIIDEVHMLSLAAFNALLKILEEPPEHLMFILATTELQKVPATILSRCQRHSFRRLGADTISRYLLEIAGRENLNLEPDAADLIARLSDGGVRDSLSLLDQCAIHDRIDVEAVYSSVGLAGKRRISELLDTILKHDSAKALQLFADMWMDGKAPASVLKELSDLLRDTMITLVAPKAGTNLISGSFEEKTLQYFGKRMTAESVVAAMETIQTALAKLRDSNNPRTSAELCIVSLCCDTAGDSVSSLRARISRLEEQVERGFVAQSAAPRFSPLTEDEIPHVEEDQGELASFEVELTEEPGTVYEEATEFAPTTEPAPSTALQPEKPASAEVHVVQESSDAALWEKLRLALLPKLPFDVRMMLEDGDRVRGSVEGNVVLLEGQSAFIANRFRRQDVMQTLIDTARSVCGRDMRIVSREKQTESREGRSLEELKQFKEVHFVSE